MGKLSAPSTIDVVVLDDLEDVVRVEPACCARRPRRRGSAPGSRAAPTRSSASRPARCCGSPGAAGWTRRRRRRRRSPGCRLRPPPGRRRTARPALRRRSGEPSSRAASAGPRPRPRAEGCVASSASAARALRPSASTTGRPALSPGLDAAGDRGDVLVPELVLQRGLRRAPSDCRSRSRGGRAWTGPGRAPGSRSATAAGGTSLAPCEWPTSHSWGSRVSIRTASPRSISSLALCGSTWSILLLTSSIGSVAVAIGTQTPESRSGFTSKSIAHAGGVRGDGEPRREREWTGPDSPTRTIGGSGEAGPLLAPEAGLATKWRIPPLSRQARRALAQRRAHLAEPADALLDRRVGREQPRDARRPRTASRCRAARSPG